GLVARDGGDRVRLIRAAEIAGDAGAAVAAATAVLAQSYWLSAVPAQIIDTSSLGAIGLSLIVANTLALRVRLVNRVLAVLGVFAGASWLLAAVVMWAELITGAQGSFVPTLETLRALAGYVGSAFYLIWAVWLGARLLKRKH